MPKTPTARGQLPRPSGNDDDYPPDDIGALADRLALLCAFDDQGPYADRPAATTARRGFYYWAVDRKLLYRCDGTNWRMVSTWVTDARASSSKGITSADRLLEIDIPFAGLYRVTVDVTFQGPSGSPKQVLSVFLDGSFSDGNIGEEYTEGTLPATISVTKIIAPENDTPLYLYGYVSTGNLPLTVTRRSMTIEPVEEF
jgi:hypothetical protein